MKLESCFTTLGSLEEQKPLNIISNNIANANSAGYKKNSVHFSDVLGEVSYASMSQGPIHETGNDLDIALSRDGFLSVPTDLGILCTRAGNLTETAQNNASLYSQLISKMSW